MKPLPIEIGLHVDAKVHFLRDLVRDGHAKLMKCSGPQDVCDALTKSLPRPIFERHRAHGRNQVPFSAFYASMTYAVEPVMAYVIELHIPMCVKKRRVSYCTSG